MSNSRTWEQIKEDNDTRLRRAQAWVQKAKGWERPHEDTTTYFIFWWIAFESLFASWRGGHKAIMNKFVQGVVSLDKDKHIADALEQESKTILKFVKLRATHLGMWKKSKDNNNEYQYKNHDAWEASFNGEVDVIKQAEKISQEGRPEEVLQVMRILFERLYTVRNQVFHGANSLADSHGSSQVCWGADLLAVFLPIFLEIVKKSIDTSSPKDWGKVSFPRIGKSDQENIRPIWEEEP